MGFFSDLFSGITYTGSIAYRMITDASCIYFWILKRSEIFSDCDIDELELNLTLGAVALACRNICCERIGWIPIGSIIVDKAIDRSYRHGRFNGFSETCKTVASCVYVNQTNADPIVHKPASDPYDDKNVFKDASTATMPQLLQMLREHKLTVKIEADETDIPFYGYQESKALRDTMKMAGIDLVGRAALPINPVL